jgi:hypothetical protein
MNDSSITNEINTSIEPTKKTNVIVIVDALVAPTSLFNQFKAAKKWSWLALALVMVVTFFSTLVFFDNMSIEWLIDQQLLEAGELSVSELEGAKAIIEQTAQYTGLISATFSVISLLVINAIFAGYYLLIGKFTKNKIANKNDTFVFSDWYSFSIWSHMPLLINTLGFSLLFLTAATNDLPLSIINYASLNQLFLGLTPEHHLYLWAESLNLFYIWSIFIATIGLKKCANLSLSKAAMIAELPYLIIFGFWFMVI